jgi:hypothetical protein
MLEILSSSLIFPALVLAFLGWLVPKMLSLVFPEGVRPLMVLAFTSAVMLMGLGIGFFIGLYVWQGVPVAMIFEDGFASGLFHFARLAGISAFIWGPMMVLSVANLPRNWVKETW